MICAVTRLRLVPYAQIMPSLRALLRNERSGADLKVKPMLDGRLRRKKVYMINWVLLILDGYYLASL